MRPGVLRALFLIAPLALHPVIGAAESLFHDCHGRLQLDFTCCCGHDAGERADAPVSLVGEEPGCCGELSAQRGPQRAAATPPSAPVPFVPLLALAEAFSPAVPGEPELPPDWRRIHGVHRAAAPPLFLRNCSFLI